MPGSEDILLPKSSNDITVLRNRILYKGNDPFYVSVKNHLQAPPFDIVYALAQSKFKISRMNILLDPNCFIILQENGKLAKCLRTGCQEIMTVWEGRFCKRCDDGPFHPHTCISVLHCTH